MTERNTHSKQSHRAWMPIGLIGIALISVIFGAAVFSTPSGFNNPGLLGHDPADIAPGTFSGTSSSLYSFPGNLAIGTTTVSADVSLEKTEAGGTTNITVSNLDGTNPSSSAAINILVGGNGAGDPYIKFGGPSVGQRVIGIDNSDGDKFKISNVLGTTDFVTIDGSGGVTKVGIATSTPSSTLTVAGTIETTSGGVKFPDGTTQTTAATGSGSSFNECTDMPTYAGLSANWVQVDSKGYNAANTVCNTAIPGSHVCSGEEIGRSISCGVSITAPSGAWFNTFAYVVDDSGLQLDDCLGWTHNQSNRKGSLWTSWTTAGYQTGHVTSTLCSSSKPFLCCS